MLYIIASSYQVAVDFCRDNHFDQHSRFVRIITRAEETRGIRLKPNDGYEYVSRPDDRPDPHLFADWQHIIETRRAR